MTMRPPRLPVRVCSIHGLAPGPDGRCVLCQRNATGDTRDASPWRTVGLLGLACMVVVGGAVMWKRSERHATVAPDVTSPALAPPTASVSPLEAEQDLAAKNEAAEERQARIERKSAEEQDRQRRSVAQVQNVRIVMYSTKPCQMCDLARDWLGKEHLAFREIDVGSDPSALADMHKLTPGNEVPVFDVDGEVLVGFGPTNVGAAVHRAADKRAR